MARTQAFDTGAAVRAAREVFWRDGFESAALPALERATGLSRSSIYNTFGSKQGLFERAVASYLDEVVRPRLAPLLADEVDPGALAAYLTGLRAVLADERTTSARHGCLLMSAAGAPIGRDDVVRAAVADYRAELRRAIGRGVDARDPAHGTSPDPADPAPEASGGGRSAAWRGAVADAVSALVLAALALVRIDRGEALRSLDAALVLVDGPVGT
ncbi:TetR/AcrR family transcriptional regulator [Nocardioides sp. ChNu-99]|uniref:TetR/AcrR family transcriptional regulator n=1 Tax=Nocardioides sp. ChNu-99 TaxID=2839897 RepID=UPI002406AE8C|nr:TetR/AcrR family transcriptional regulator [Nocardioides sp. ChNu-99]MDF9716149.1 TetR/AcrR family transcriptional regulator; helix-turn-helix transcriptional regulator [Nocardioides sp. ChNu-99]